MYHGMTHKQKEGSEPAGQKRPLSVEFTCSFWPWVGLVCYSDFFFSPHSQKHAGSFNL